MDPVTKALELAKQAKLQSVVPFWGRKKKLQDLQLDEFKRKIAGEQMQRDAKSLSRIANIDDPMYAESLIRKHGGLEGALSSLPKDKVLGKVEKRIQSGSKPKMDQSVAFLSDVIQESYPKYTETYHARNDVADAMREYIRLSKEYKHDLETLTRKLDQLVYIMSINMNIPHRELSPLVHEVVPRAFLEPRFY